jgi:UDP-sugar transporter A1/2/3
MWVRNVQLASFSVVIGVAQQFASAVVSVSASAAPKPPMHGFDHLVWIMILNNAVGGLLVALVIKHADNILKGFSTAMATVRADRPLRSCWLMWSSSLSHCQT